VAKEKQYTYRTSLRWTGERRGKLASSGETDLDVATPPEFSGHEGVWWPESLLVGSLESCVMLTFLYFAERADLQLVEYSSEAEGRLSVGGGKMTFTGFTVRAEIVVATEDDVEAARKALGRAADACLVTQSLGPDVDVQANVRAAKG
jgi:organic hydroperoxide reductase OsmC/OhrA